MRLILMIGALLVLGSVVAPTTSAAQLGCDDLLPQQHPDDPIQLDLAPCVQVDCDFGDLPERPGGCRPRVSLRG